MIGMTNPLAAADPPRQTPYWASIGVSRARTRTGPERTYPANWEYRRTDLPVKVVGVFKQWRKIEDPNGQGGWMLVNLLRDTRTAVVSARAPVEMREQPDQSSRIRYRAAPGVVGRIDECGNGWCRFDVKGKSGFVDTDDLWGAGD